MSRLYRIVMSLLLVGALSACSSNYSGSRTQPVGYGYNASPIDFTIKEDRERLFKDFEKRKQITSHRADRREAAKLRNKDSRTTGPKLDPVAARKIINAYRQRNGLRPLKLDLKLVKAARAHSKDLAKHDKISHRGSDGSKPWDRVVRAGYNPGLTAENVGTGQMTLTEVLRGWQHSPSHKKNLLLPDATHMGIALVHNPKSGYKTFWTLVLGRPL